MSEHPDAASFRDFVLRVEQQRALLDRARKMIADLRRDCEAVPALDAKEVLDQLALLLNEDKP